jgi:hypothetical protein
VPIAPVVTVTVTVRKLDLTMPRDIMEEGMRNISNE